MPLPRFSFQKMPVTRSVYRHLPLLILASSLLGVYLYTLAPGLTWANDGSDGGDLITAAYTGGIAHPTGYPLYLILARLFQFIPIGSLAFRTNLMSALFAVLSAVLLYRIVSRSLDDLGFEHTWFAGMTAGFAFGLSPLLWSQAVITEVHTLQAFLTVSILYLYIFPFRALEQKHLERLRGLVLGLAMGNHVTTVFLIPLAFFSGITGRQGERTLENPGSFASSLARQLVWLAIGLSIYLTLPLRAIDRPACQLGKPNHAQAFLVAGIGRVVPKLLSAISVWGYWGAPASLGFTVASAIWLARTLTWGFWFDPSIQAFPLVPVYDLDKCGVQRVRVCVFV